jgi:hypothetical protein
LNVGFSIRDSDVSEWVRSLRLQRGTVGYLLIALGEYAK